MRVRTTSARYLPTLPLGGLFGDRAIEAVGVEATLALAAQVDDVQHLQVGWAR